MDQCWTCPALNLTRPPDSLHDVARLWQVQCPSFRRGRILGQVMQYLKYDAMIWKRMCRYVQIIKVKSAQAVEIGSIIAYNRPLSRQLNAALRLWLVSIAQNYQPFEWVLRKVCNVSGTGTCIACIAWVPRIALQSFAVYRCLQRLQVNIARFTMVYERFVPCAMSVRTCHDLPMLNIKSLSEQQWTASVYLPGAWMERPDRSQNLGCGMCSM